MKQDKSKESEEWTGTMVAAWSADDFSWAYIANRHNASVASLQRQLKETQAREIDHCRRADTAEKAVGDNCFEIARQCEVIARLEQDLAGMTLMRDTYAEGFSTQSRLHGEFARESDAQSKVIEQLRKALVESLAEINAREFITNCINNGISPKLKQLWLLRQKINDTLTLSSPIPTKTTKL